jgi:predicted DNA repair protein MutK
VLSAEIVAISLGEVASAPFLTQVLALYVISVVMTVGVYGVVAGLVKIDDLGEALVRAGGARVPLGRAIVRAAPRILHAIATIGTAAMLLVGGQILLHGIPPLAHAVEQLVVGRPALVRAAVGMLADLGVGVVSGGILVAAASTGIPARMLGFVRRADRASGRTPRTR